MVEDQHVAELKRRLRNAVIHQDQAAATTLRAELDRVAGVNAGRETRVDEPSALQYEVRITATGTVRDADGNVISEQPIETTAVLTGDEVQALTEGEPS